MADKASIKPRISEVVVFKSKSEMEYCTGLIMRLQYGANHPVRILWWTPGGAAKIENNVQYDPTGEYHGTWCYPQDLPEDIEGVTAPSKPPKEED